MNATPLGTDSCLREGEEMTENDPNEDEPSTLDNGALSEMTSLLRILMRSPGKTRS